MTVVTKFNGVAYDLQVAQSLISVTTGSGLVGELTIQLSNDEGQYNNYFSKGDSFELFMTQDGVDYYQFVGIIDDISTETSKSNITTIRVKGLDSLIKERVLSRRYLPTDGFLFAFDVIAKVLEDTGLDQYIYLVGEDETEYTIGHGDSRQLGYPANYVVNHKTPSEVITSVCNDFGLRWWITFNDDQTAALYVRQPAFIDDDPITNITLEIEDGRAINKIIQNQSLRKYNKIYLTLDDEPLVEQDIDDIKETGHIREFRYNGTVPEGITEAQALQFMRTLLELETTSPLKADITVVGDARIVPGLIVSINDTEGKFDPNDLFEVLEVDSKIGKTYTMNLKLERVEYTSLQYDRLALSFKELSNDADDEVIVSHIETATMVMSNEDQGNDQPDEMDAGYGYTSGLTDGGPKFTVLQGFEDDTDPELATVNSTLAPWTPNIGERQGQLGIRVLATAGGNYEIRWNPTGTIDLSEMDRIEVVVEPDATSTGDTFRINVRDGSANSTFSSDTLGPAGTPQVITHSFSRTDGVDYSDIDRIDFIVLSGSGSDFFYIDGCRGRYTGESWDSASDSITQFADRGDATHVIVTSTGHNILNGDTVHIWGTTNYNGSFTVSAVTANTFDIVDTWAGDDATGTWSIGDNTSFNEDYDVGCALFDVDFFVGPGTGLGNNADLSSSAVHVQGTKFTTSSSHGFVVGDTIYIDSVDSEYLGWWAILEVPSPTEFVTQSDYSTSPGIGVNDYATKRYWEVSKFAGPGV